MLGYAILLFLIIVIGTVVIFLAMGKSADSDVQRVKDRLLGKTKTQKTKEGSGETPSLIERAGLKWSSAKLMQMALGCALGGFCFAWYMLPPPFDKFAWGFGILGFCG